MTSLFRLGSKVKGNNLSKVCWLSSSRFSSSVYNGQTYWDIFPRMPRVVDVGDVSIRDGFQHETRFVSTEAKKTYLQELVFAGAKHIEVTNLGSPAVMPQFSDFRELMEFARSDKLKKGCLKRGINYSDIVFTCVTIREYAVDIACELAQEGIGPDRCLMMVSTDENHHRQNSGLSLEDYWKEAKNSIKKAHDNGMTMCGTVSTIWGSPVGGGYPTDLEDAVKFTQKWFDLGADTIEHADHDGSASAPEVYDYFCRILEKWPDPYLHICHFHETKRGVGNANILAALQAGINRFEATLGGTGGQPTNWLDDRPVRGTGAYYYKDPEPLYVGLVCLEDVLVQLDEMGIITNWDINRVLELGKNMEKTLGRRLRSDVIRNGRTPHKEALDDEKKWNKKKPFVTP